VTSALAETAQIQFISAPTVELIDHMGGDASFIRAARVSTRGKNTPPADPQEAQGLINYLLKSRHGSVFEHATLTFYIEASIFTFREFHRHRIASYNETSARYRELPPRFYVPPTDRPLQNAGTSARPELTPGTPQQTELLRYEIQQNSRQAWERYQILLRDGIAKEIARAVLPVNIMSQMYATLNPRSLMNFLSLRVDHPEAAIRTRPQYEIQQVAQLMETHFQNLFPVTHAAFNANGRQAP
jgi:thymidylate synthase (FAD)